MYKMKEVCSRTGLSEKTVRFYITEKMISPEVIPGIHYRTYRFSEADIKKLSDIAALRSADFSLAQIRVMLAFPEKIPEIIASKQEEVSRKITELQLVKDALESLTVQEQTEYTKVADALNPREPERKETPGYARNRLVWLMIYCGLILLLGLAVTGGRNIWLAGTVPLLLVGIEFPIKGLTYARYNRKWRSRAVRCSATVISVISDENVEANWEYTNKDAIHDVMHMGFLHWGWICPDHWIPLLQFEADGKMITAAYRYGGLRGSWGKGSAVEIAYDPGKEKQIYPCNDPVIRKKAVIYCVLGLLSMCICVVMMCSLLK